jgi:hypothetical protein
MDSALGLIILVVGMLLAFPLFAISAKLSRNRKMNRDPELQAEADSIFEAELRDDNSGAAS